ncbi:TetR/AcrR family transcriptional regulator [Nocardiopsis sp. RSe5-2]|uniref:TetR/AcrR family transcriptional regulator n=1 Tax=Nocardiopsis endophytica TaxID=3018445 RepID=A0ABT4U728_9ACTN|nr:TetR/AcrR family transcriptional regulator [Nocardiopsis endophytica]MDA2812731.1 TetR/AcrR family transcriptional regulator [Nocardiopsis endophytica]
MAEPETPAPRRAPAGAAVLQEDVTRAIRAAVFTELATSGYGRLSIEAVAKRAGVGKTAVYRRWKSKLELVLDVVSEVAGQVTPVPDTGSLRGDVHELVTTAAQALRHPLARQIVPDLLAEAARSPEIAATLEEALQRTQRGIAGVVIRNAVERGELPEGTDPELALDLILGPVYWRLAVIREELTPAQARSLTRAAMAALADAGTE